MPKVTDFQIQQRNANKHSQRGMNRLENSVQSDGWIGAITVAADGETFDGSARLEIAADKFGDVEPIIVESDGTRPIVHIRRDIPDAKDARAVRLGIAANRVAELNLEWDAELLAELGEEIDLGELFTAQELQDIGVEVPDFAPVGEDEQPRLDEKRAVVCPECGHEFIPK